MSTTPRSALPLLAAAQAQKHVTHNEALLQLDALACARFLDRDLSAPPSSPADGDTYLVKATASGDWTGQDGNIAYALDGAWRFAPPFAGFMAYVADENIVVVYTGSSWVDLTNLLTFENLAMLGVNTSADSTNKLAVKSSALLFDNIGGTVQAKVNKHASADTASLLYQTNYSGRAEFGLCGDDNFHAKVSPDGSSWTDAVVIDKTSGALTLAAGAKLPNGSAASPALALNGNYGLFYDTTNSGIGLSLAGVEAGYVKSGLFRLSLTGGASNQLSVQAESTANNQVETYNATASTASAYTMRRGRGTIASPAVAANGDIIGNLNWQPYTGASGTGFSNGARIQGVVTETATLDASHVGMQICLFACPIGSATLTEVARFDNESGLSLFGANPVIDKNRLHVFRGYTVATLPTGVSPYSEAYVSDAASAYPTGAGSAPAGGGTAKRKVYTVDGTNWLMF